MPTKPTIRIGLRDILFENQHFIAINKKRGWLVHATLDKSRTNVFDSLRSYLKVRDGVEQYLGLLHRLDIGTTGVLLFTKTKTANKILSQQFHQRTVEKIYRAVCVGRPKNLEGEISNFLAPVKHGKVEKMSPVVRKGKKAITRYKVISTDEKTTHVEFAILTGRRHQIRSHAATLGIPIVGDPLYGCRQFDVPIRLHAFALTFVGTEGQTITINAALPTDFFKLEQPTVVTSTYLFNKPFGVHCQFTAKNPEDKTLADFNLPEGIYPVGRLDKDSEGLVILSNDKRITLLSDKTANVYKTYVVQVENIAQLNQIKKLEDGVFVKGKTTLPAKVEAIPEPKWLWKRTPPIRKRVAIPTSWLKISIREGRNRQVRRMCAAVGLPVLRLIRIQIGNYELEKLPIGVARKV